MTLVQSATLRGRASSHTDRTARHCRTPTAATNST